MNQSLTELDQIVGNLLICNDPALFKTMSSQLSRGNRFEKKNIKKYLLLSQSIMWCLKKILRYELYFNKFYPKTKQIPKIEALEHHVHAYLEDLTTLKNKLSHYIGTLKNDLNHIASNKTEINEALTWLNKKISKSFENVSQNRDPHRHRGYRFVDDFIAEGGFANTMLNTEGTRQMLSQNGVLKLQKQEEISFQKGKEYWSQNANKNYQQVLGLTNAVFEKTKGFLYRFLDIQPIDSAQFKK